MLRITGKTDVPAEFVVGVSTKNINAWFVAKFLNAKKFENVLTDKGYIVVNDTLLPRFAVETTMNESANMLSVAG